MRGAHARQSVVHRSPGLLPGHVEVLGPESHLVLYGLRAELGLRVLLDHASDRGRGCRVVENLPVELDRALHLRVDNLRDEPAYSLHPGRFPGRTPSEEKDELSLVDMERYAVDSGLGPVLIPHVEVLDV